MRLNLSLYDPVEKVPLVGPQAAKKLEKLEIRSVEDLLHHYPFRYDDFSEIKKISEIVLGQTVTVLGKLIKIENIYTKSRRNLIKARLADETGQIDLVWFNQPFLVKTLKDGSMVNIAGRVGEFSGKLAFVSPEYEQLSPSTNIHTGRLVPIYPETAGLSSKWLRARIAQLLGLKIEISDYLPEEVKTNEILIDLREALEKIHFPKNTREIELAKKRLAFDEIFNLQLRSAVVKRAWQDKTSNFQFFRQRRIHLGGTIINFQSKIDKFIKGLPFELTNSQAKVAEEILQDLSQNRPMNRLLQGDVGCGKTVVAAIAAYATHLSGYQTVYMAPTEILASQHFNTFKSLLENYPIDLGLVTSSTGKDFRNQRSKIKGQILIGTHALLYRLKEIEKVGLVIIDEQHKFGVEQRGELLKIVSEFKNRAPHLLTMTATPIPRSLALTVFGELEMSVIEEMPKERKKIKTWYVPKAKREAAYGWIKKEIKNQGSQVYIVCPFIEESAVETLKSVRAAKKEFERLQAIFRPHCVALLHGKLKADEKAAVMKDFTGGRINLLVATPVVEVGIDNPHATIILIEAAERFGLASLHQLRGRVGRGSKTSYCLLFSETETPATIERLKILEKYHSGLLLSEMDLKRRGMGTIFGKDQSGFIKTKIANLSDRHLIERVKGWAQKLLSNPRLEDNLLWQEKISKISQKTHLD